MYSATEGWLLDLTRVIDNGLRISPRGCSTIEMIGFRSTIVDMRYPIVVSPERKLGYKFLAGEAAWILSGDNKVETISPYSKEIAKFSDDGYEFFGAYGPKIVQQLPYVVRTLAEDPDTRQAVLNIWRESPGKSKDIPCTTNVQFMIRDGKLHCIDTMRSSDLWLGHPYDVFNFSMLSLQVLLDLRDNYGVKVELGTLYLQSGSKHIYETNFDAVRRVLLDHSATGGVYPGPKVDPSRFNSSAGLINHLWNLAKSGNAAEEELWAA